MFKLPSVLFKIQGEGLENLPQETFVDIMTQNRYLRWFTLFLLLGLCGTLADLIWQTRKRPEIIFVNQPAATTYADGPANARPPAETVAPPAPAQTDVEPVAIPKSPFGKNPSTPNIYSQGAMGMPDKRQDPSPPIDTPSEFAPPPRTEKPASLWALSDTLKNDPRREVLDKTFRAGYVTITFKEASPAGLISFDLLNDGRQLIYLPILEIRERKSTAFIERRVLEPGSRTTGILQTASLEGTEHLDLTFTAANAKPSQFKLEVPQW